MYPRFPSLGFLPLLRMRIDYSKRFDSTEGSQGSKAAMHRRTRAPASAPNRQGVSPYQGLSEPCNRTVTALSGDKVESNGR